MPRKRSYGRKSFGSRRVSRSRGRSGYSQRGGMGGVRRGRSASRTSRGQTVRIEIVQPGSNPLQRPDLIGLGLVKPSERKPL